MQSSIPCLRRNEGAMTPVRLVATLLRRDLFDLDLPPNSFGDGACAGRSTRGTAEPDGRGQRNDGDPDVAGAGHRACRQFVSPRSRCITQRPGHRLAFSARKFGGRAKRTQRHLLRSGARRERRGHRCAIERSRRDYTGRRWAATRLWARLPFTAEPSAEPLWQALGNAVSLTWGRPQSAARRLPI